MTSPPPCQKRFFAFDPLARVHHHCSICFVAGRFSLSFDRTEKPLRRFPINFVLSNPIFHSIIAFKQSGVRMCENNISVVAVFLVFVDWLLHAAVVALLESGALLQWVVGLKVGKNKTNLCIEKHLQCPINQIQMEYSD